MAEYPLHLARRRRLADGRQVTLRPMRAEDGLLADLDYDRHMAFVCQGADGAIVGNASYLVNPDARSCEFGIFVADGWRRAGVARLLMDALVRAAQARRLDTMEGLVLSENRGMLAFARTLDFALTPEPRDPALVRVVKKL